MDGAIAVKDVDVVDNIAHAVGSLDGNFGAII